MDVSKVADKNKISEKLAETNVQGAQSAKTKAVTADKAATVQNAKVPNSSITERVKWSPDAELIAEGVLAAKASTDSKESERAQRIAQLKAKVQGGLYKTDASKIADSMLQSSFEEDLLTRKS